MSTLASSPTPLPSWKQEVNRRLAEHKNRRGISVVDNDAAGDQQSSSNSRAASAAARVAARFAKTPSYSDMQATEARGALRAAEATTKIAMEAQAAAQAELDRIEDGDPQFEAAEYGRQPVGTAELSQQLYGSPAAPTARAGGVEGHWEPGMPVRENPQPGRITNDSETWAEVESGFDQDIYGSVETAQTIPANLIAFPREIVATRRMRPRSGEAQSDGQGSDQLSIFEVETGAGFSSESRAGALRATDRQTGTERQTATERQSWVGSSWQQIKLEDQAQALPDYYAIVPDEAVKLYQAPFSRRMLATTVDAALILSIVCGLAYLVAARLDHLPSMRTSEICGAVATLGLAALYEWFFLTFAKVTPGMRYAQLSLCTFDEQMPNAAQVKSRLRAMLISVLPVGLGMVWSIFDEDQMSWHDRLSMTYLRLS